MTLSIPCRISRTTEDDIYEFVTATLKVVLTYSRRIIEIKITNMVYYSNLCSIPSR